MSPFCPNPAAHHAPRLVRSNVPLSCLTAWVDPPRFANLLSPLTRLAQALLPSHRNSIMDSTPPVDKDGKVLCTCERCGTPGARIAPATYKKHNKHRPLPALDSFLSTRPLVHTPSEQASSSTVPKKRKSAPSKEATPIRASKQSRPSANAFDDTSDLDVSPIDIILSLLELMGFAGLH